MSTLEIDFAKKTVNASNRTQCRGLEKPMSMVVDAVRAKFEGYCSLVGNEDPALVEMVGWLRYYLGRCI